MVLADNREGGMLLAAGPNVTHTHRKVADQRNLMCASAVHVAVCLHENTFPLLYYFPGFHMPFSGPQGCHSQMSLGNAF